MNRRPFILPTLALVATAAFSFAGAPKASAQDQTSLVPTVCIVSTFTDSGTGPQILRERSTPVSCDDYASVKGAADAAASSTCPDVVSQVDSSLNVPPWSTAAIGAEFPANTPGAISAITGIVGTKACVTAPGPMPQITAPPVAAVEETTTTTAAPEATTTTEAAPVTEAPQASSSDDTLAPLPVVAAEAPAEQLPVTGAHTGLEVTIGCLLLAAGGTALAYDRSRRGTVR